MMLDRIDPKHLPVIYRIAKTRLRPFFADPRAMIALRAHVLKSGTDTDPQRPTEDR